MVYSYLHTVLDFQVHRAEPMPVILCTTDRAALRKSSCASCSALLFSSSLLPCIQDLTSEEVMELEFSRIACLQIPNEYPPGVQNIMKACWQQDPSQRPSFLLIAKILTNLI